MGKIKTEKAALYSAYVMKQKEYYPSTLINVGVGTSHEYQVWKWLLPNAELVGIDPRLHHRMWKDSYIRAAIGKRSGRSVYCYKHRSTSCGCRDKPWPVVTTPRITLDQASEFFSPPYFLWMDCEGSEFDALRGASKTLENTRFITIEIRNHDFKPRNTRRLRRKLQVEGFSLYCAIDDENFVYWKKDFSND